MKTISFKEAKSGDWLVSDGGSVRLPVVNVASDYLETNIRAYSGETWRALGFHVEREDPPKPKVVRIELASWESWKISPEGCRRTLLIFPADLLEELDEAVREMDIRDVESCGRVRCCLTVCGIGTARAEGDLR